MQQRYYDPIAGRFLSVDPIVTDANTGKMFGRYTYVENNPYAKVDPDGRESVGEMIDRNATEAASAGNGGATFGWAFAGVAWKAFGAEGISQIADKGSAASTSDKVGAVAEIAAVIPGGKLVGKLVSGVEKAAEKALSKEAAKGIRSLEKRIAEHEKKLADFKENPTVRPGMEGQSKEAIAAQQQARIEHLEKEIKTFKDNIEKLKDTQ